MNRDMGNVSDAEKIGQEPGVESMERSLEGEVWKTGQSEEQRIGPLSSQQLGTSPRGGSNPEDSGGALSSAAEDGLISQPMPMEPGELCAAPAGLMTPYDSISRNEDGFPGSVASYSTSNSPPLPHITANLPTPDGFGAGITDSIPSTLATTTQYGRMRGGVSPPKTPPLGPLMSQLNKPITTRSHRTDQTPLVQLDLTTAGRERIVSQPATTMHPSPDASTYAGTDSAGTSGTALTVDTRNPGQSGTISSSNDQPNGQEDSSPSGRMDLDTDRDSIFLPGILPTGILIFLFPRLDLPFRS